MPLSSEQTAIGVTAASLMTLGAPAALHCARTSAALGVDSFWTAETTGLDAWAILAAVAVLHPELDLGTGVIPAQTRTPLLAAMGAATVQSLVPGREVHLGVGVSSPVVVERWHGAEHGRNPVERMREYLGLLRLFLDGDTVTFDGEFHRTNRSRLAVPLPAERPQLVLGALNRRMLRLAGESADGVLLNYLPATSVPWCIDRVREGERDSGRPVGSCTIHAYIHVGVGDRERAANAARRDLHSYAVVDAYASAFSRAGFADEVDEIRARHAAGDRDGAVGAVSDRMIDAIDIVGDSTTVAAAVDAYVAAGVTSPIVMPLPWGADRLATVDATIDAAVGAHRARRTPRPPARPAEAP